MLLLEKQVCLVTGGSRGIGRAIVERFASAGASVAFTYHSSSAAADELVAQLQAQYPTSKFQAYQSDAASFQAATELAEQVIQTFGRLDVLVNNAGIARDNLLLRLTEAQWDEVMNNNLKSVFNLTKQVVKQMLRQKSGSIINITSIIGIKGNAGQSNYAAAKAGIIGFTKSIAQEIGSRNIRCNAIAPGYIETDMTDNLSADVKAGFAENIPLKRLGKPEEVANTALFLASSLSAYVSGQTISVCGGLTT